MLSIIVVTALQVEENNPPSLWIAQEKRNADVWSRSRQNQIGSQTACLRTNLVVLRSAGLQATNRSHVITPSCRLFPFMYILS